jgi:hypothetical protein
MKIILISIFLLGININGFNQNNKIEFIYYRDLVKCLDTMHVYIPEWKGECHLFPKYRDCCNDILNKIILLDTEKIELIEKLRPDPVYDFRKYLKKLNLDTNKRYFSTSAKYIQEFFVKEDMKKRLISFSPLVIDIKKIKIYDVYIKDKIALFSLCNAYEGCCWKYRATLADNKLLIEYIGIDCI